MRIGVYGKPTQPFVGRRIKALYEGIVAGGHKAAWRSPSGFIGSGDVETFGGHDWGLVRVRRQHEQLPLGVRNARSAS